MPREDDETRRAELPRSPRREADAAQAAEAICATLQAVDAALSPILGARGVAALYKRSLYLTGADHPWLGALHQGVEGTIDVAALKPVVAQQTRADAAAGGHDLLQNYYQLLASLIGPSLTERLLRSVWADSPSGAPPQDPSP